MVFECYVCSLCGESRNETFIVRCECCEEPRCYDCLGVNNKFEHMFHRGLLKSEYCQNCKDIENNKYVYLMFFGEDMCNITIEVFHDKIKANEKLLKLANDYYKEQNDGKEYKGDDDIFTFLGIENEIHCWIERREIM